MKLIDSFPTHRAGSLQYCIGRMLPFGATVTEEGAINFSIFSKEATGCTLVLYHRGEQDPFAEILLPEEFRIGDVYAVMVFGINIEDTEYGYRFDGPWDPEHGLRFDASRVLLDPYARSISGRSLWGKRSSSAHDGIYRGQFVREDYNWEGDKPLELPPRELIIYELHIRSFTNHPSSGVHFRGKYAGLMEKIPYLKQLGINCVELMPVFEFDECEGNRSYEGEQLYNYWGYSTVGFFAPKAGYAVNAPLAMESDEFKAMIRTLHLNGIEVILDVVFNHTAEGGENGPTISFRGIDNRTYYLLNPDGTYVNLSGCGNTMNCNQPVVRNVVLDCLRYWVSAFHVDGFRFDLASIMTRDQNGNPMPSPPLLDTLSHDAILGGSILIAEAWDAGGLYQVGSFPDYGRWAEWNGIYRDTLRRFVKGDAGAAPDLILRIEGSPDLYGTRGPTASINYVTCHDGFTLYDLVSYNHKHNESNGEYNRDGCSENYSWNCGAEGETDNPDILALRFRQMKNLLSILLTSRGVPMLLSGDEFANSQGGNNNAYCHDSEVSWLLWTGLEKHSALFDHVRRLIAFRKAHPVLSADSYDFSHNGTGYPELSFHGTRAWDLDRHSPGLCLSYMFAEDHEKYGTAQDSFLYIAVNAHWEDHRFELPLLPPGHVWSLAFESYGVSTDPGEHLPHKDQSGIRLGPRTVAILVGSPGQAPSV